MRFRQSITAVLFVVLALAGCSAPAQPSSQPTATAPLLAEHGLEGLDSRQIIEKLDTMPVAERPADLMASIRPNELVLSDDRGESVSLPMPEDAFYVSIAPYLSQTHDCYFHSLTTCQGELSKTDVEVQVSDSDTNQTVIDETVQTFDNGFAGLWLPRDLDGTLTVSSAGRSASMPLSTGGAEEPTCLTTLKLT